MWFWWFMFFCNLLYPVALILGGWMMGKHCPKQINGYFGYRTKMSKLNEETWKFANENCGKHWWIAGWIFLIPDILVQLPFRGKSEDAIGNLGLVLAVVGIVVILGSVIPTEMALKKTFYEDGTRKKK